MNSESNRIFLAGRIVSYLHEANMNSSTGIAIILGVISMMALASTQSNETVRMCRFSLLIE